MNPGQRGDPQGDTNGCIYYYITVISVQVVSVPENGIFLQRRG